ncbi:Gfo/Idh/MocA family oxidoreductase [Mesobacillus maritimus]|uniref:Gfo/Idh/MocA family protein n=1 Tax=Mesobacillus maritimus TaxID=1643336 RepID=UPI00203E620D|nr:Gfo/Idh/MocA family oxidoreductase [Mesobacillus maritimus]MCM3668289.1 Gfo/Idh/MocA family oxidoreductase [Mesobacillus maritimus]
MNQLNVGIIGAGRIASKYLRPILENENFHLLAICDVKDSVEETARKYNALFYHDYQKLLLNDEIDLVIITTPPKEHFQIAKNSLLHKKNVILEKPAVLNMVELNVLLELARKNNVHFDVVFHWKYGNEVLYLREKIKDFGELKRIECTVLDPYTDDSYQIKEEFIGLEGSWVDSGINGLSLLSSFMDVRDLQLMEKKVLYDEKSNLDYYSKYTYAIKDKNISITVDWRYNANHKYTHIYFEKDVLYLDHSSQRIFLNNQLLVDLNNGDRLENHYQNYFKLYSTNSMNHDEIYNIHHLLFRDQ